MAIYVSMFIVGVLFVIVILITDEIKDNLREFLEWGDLETSPSLVLYVASFIMSLSLAVGLVIDRPIDQSTGDHITIISIIVCSILSFFIQYWFIIILSYIITLIIYMPMKYIITIIQSFFNKLYFKRNHFYVNKKRYDKISVWVLTILLGFFGAHDCYMQRYWRFFFKLVILVTTLILILANIDVDGQTNEFIIDNEIIVKYALRFLIVLGIWWLYDMFLLIIKSVVGRKKWL
jgi:hypothetical protein